MAKKYRFCEHKRLWKVWNTMKCRCYKPSHDAYPNYGGRGVTVCDEWLHDFNAFATWAFANGYDENAPFGKCTIDRIDVNGKYEPSNCRFVSLKEQSNNRRTNRFVEYNGETHTVSEWESIIGFPRGELGRRLRNGWNPHDAINTPLRVRKDGNNKTITDGSKTRNRIVKYNGEAHTIADWSRITGIKYCTIHKKLKDGMCVEEALTRPVRRALREE